jgi:hypothetical protein
MGSMGSFDSIGSDVQGLNAEWAGSPEPEPTEPTEPIEPIEQDLLNPVNPLNPLNQE